MEENSSCSEEQKDFLGQSFAKIQEAYRRAVRDALLRHKRLGNSVAVGKNGKVVILGPDEIAVDDIADEVSER
jgi:hypothetical protein